MELRKQLFIIHTALETKEQHNKILRWAMKHFPNMVAGQFDYPTQYGIQISGVDESEVEGIVNDLFNEFKFWGEWETKSI